MISVLWETGEVIDFLQGRKTVSLRCALEGDVTLAHREFTARVVSFAVDQLCSKDEARARIFAPNVAPGLAFDATGGDARDDEPMRCRDDDDGDDWDFADVPVAC